MSESRVAGRRRAAVALHSLAHFVWREHLAPLGRLAAFLRRIGGLGVAGWLPLLIVMAAAVVAALPAPDAFRAIAHLVLFVTVWSVSLAAAASQRTPWLLLAVTPWLAFYQLLSLNVWVGTPVVVAPTLVVLVLVHRALAVWPRRGIAFACWPVVALAFAHATATASGLRHALGWTPVTARAGVALVVTAVGWGVFAAHRAQPRPPLRYGRAVVAAALVFGAAMGAAAVRNLSVTVDWVDAMTADLAAVVVLFWMWLGGRAGTGAVHAAEWIARQSLRVMPSRSRAVAVAFATAAAAWGFVEGLRAIVQSVLASKQSGALSGLTLLTLAAGLAAEIGARERSWASMPDARVRRQLAWLLLCVGCAVLLSTMPGVGWRGTRSLMLLTGVLHLAVPSAVAAQWRDRAASLPDLTRAALFATGYLGGLLALLVDPRRDVALLALVPLLVAVLLVLRWRMPALGPVAGALGGALFGAGAVAAWMMPYPPTIAFLGLQPWADVLTHWGDIGRMLMTGRHLLLLVAAWSIGAVGGALVCRADGRARLREELGEQRFLRV